MKTTQVILSCDLHKDGTVAVTTFNFTYGSTRATLDLCQEHLDEVRKVFDSYSGQVTETPRLRVVPAPARITAAALRAAEDMPAPELREWAQSQGIEVGTAGRISKRVKEAFAASLNS